MAFLQQRGDCGFQTIRPVIVPSGVDRIRSVTYALDHQPYNVNYTIGGMINGSVQFQYNLYVTGSILIETGSRHVAGTLKS